MKNDILDDKQNNTKTGWSSEGHALTYLKKTAEIPHRSEGENVLFDHIPIDVIRVLILELVMGIY